ncbi:tetraspanin 37 [Mastacembelus armatus]|uniref:Tetraspanin n=1 Tax=Mastacembelus armatus TaxID=205130 RepID=A0A3Q3L0Y3_9TELE|nr:tetraspanin-3-like [Mastacembelus armatus]
MSDRRRNACKTLLQLLCQLLWVMGLVVCLGAVSLLMKYRQCSLFFSHAYITLPAILTLATAAFLVASGFLGTWLSFKDSTFLQGLFVYLLVIVFCMESTASALAYFRSVKLDSELVHLSRVFHNYSGSSQDPNSRAVDAIQEELQCCGIHDYRDWMETPWFNHTGGLRVPHSCCNSTFSMCNGTVDQPQQLYTQGCQLELEKALHFVLSFIMWCFPLIFLVEVFLFVTVAQLMRDHAVMDYQILDIN